MRTRTALALAVSAALLIPCEALGSVGCTVDGGAVAITTSDFAEGVALLRAGDAIEVTDDRTGIPVACEGGPPAIGTVTRLVVTAALDETSVYIDRAGGEFAGVAFELTGPSMFLGVGGTDGRDLAAFGTRDGTTVGSLTVDGEEIVAADAINVLARGGGKGDHLTAAGVIEGPRGSFGALRVSATFEGGAGADFVAGGTQPDVLLGNSGSDVIVGGRGPDEIDCGAGRDTVIDARRRDRVRRCERSIS
jgi:Ca2+-binding RTX toxin-like protein